MKKNFTVYIVIITIVAILIIASYYFVSMSGDQDNPEESNNPSDKDKEIITTASIPVISGSVGSSGGSISVSDSPNPLFGLSIDVPKAATDEPIDFDISYSNVTEIYGLPEEASVAGKMIKIETDGSSNWNEYKSFDDLIKVTLPYDPSLVSSNETVRFYAYDDDNEILSSAGFISQDKTSNTISFYTRTFSSFVAVKLSLADHEYFGKNFSVDTGFRPKNDGFYIRNYGSYITRGNCMGMVSFARFYYMYKKGIDGTGLYEKYREGDRNEWRDDETAIQIATRAHLAEHAIWDKYDTREFSEQIPASLDVAISWIHGMIVTGSPQLIYINQRLANGTRIGAHAILTYKYANGRFDIYDPNYPGTDPGTDARQIPFTYNNWFTRSYSSGTTTGYGAYQYNIFYHIGYKAFHPTNVFDQIYRSAENGFKDSLFPTINLTDYYSDGTTPIDTDGDGIRDTPELKTTISGTITGGQKKVNSTLIYVSNKKFKTRVDANGKFSQEVPLYAGNNELIILATDTSTLYQWAGFLRDTIDTSASKSAFSLTLTWDQDQCDLDLHVLEPTIEGYVGRHIYPHGGQGATIGYPYMTIDNQEGYGPEQYIATENMTLPNYQGDGKSLYGTYKFRVHYNWDSDNNPKSTQQVNWTVHMNYLAFNDTDAGVEFWAENTWTGTLSSADFHNTQVFDNSDSSWSQIYEIEYKRPNPLDYGIPPPPQNQLP